MQNMWNNDTAHLPVMESDSWETENKHCDYPTLLTWEYFQALVQAEGTQEYTWVEPRVQGNQNY